MSVKDQFGGGNFGGGRGFKNVKVKDLIADALKFRVIPAMKSLAAKGECTHFHKRHFGYFGTAFKDRTKSVPKPFVCIERRDSDGMTVESCPECRNVERHEKMLKDARAAAETAAKSRGVLDANQLEKAVGTDPTVASLTEWLSSHNLDKKVFFNVVLSDSSLAVLEMGSRARDNLKLKCAELRKPPYSIEPISDPDQGVWFEASCSSPGKQDNVTTFTYETEKVGAGFQVKGGPLSEALLTKILEVLPDLTDAGLTFLDAQQIEALVKCDGDPTTVDTIMGMSRAKQAPSSQPLAPPPPVPAAPPPSPVDDEEAQLAAQLEAQAARLAALRARKATPAAPPPPTEASPASPAPANPLSPALSPEAFRNLFPRPGTA